MRSYRKRSAKKSPRRSHRKSPMSPMKRATGYAEGAKRKGRDGHYYKVMIGRDGKKHWARCSKKVNCRYSRLVGPQIGSGKRRSYRKRSKSPKRKSKRRSSAHKSPLKRASGYAEGAKRKGRDGHYYKVMIGSDGKKHWKKCSKRVNCRYSKLVGPQIGSGKRRSYRKKSKSPKRKSKRRSTKRH